MRDYTLALPLVKCFICNSFHLFSFACFIVREMGGNSTLLESYCEISNID